MTLLLDPHFLPRWLDDPKRLSRSASDAGAEGKTLVDLRAVVWEIAFKKTLGQLEAPDDLDAAMSVNRLLAAPGDHPPLWECALCLTSTAIPSIGCSSSRGCTKVSNSSAATRTCRCVA